MLVGLVYVMMWLGPKFFLHDLTLPSVRITRNPISEKESITS